MTSMQGGHITTPLMDIVGTGLHPQNALQHRSVQKKNMGISHIDPMDFGDTALPDRGHHIPAESSSL